MEQQVLATANAQAHELTLVIGVGALALIGAWSIVRAMGLRRFERVRHAWHSMAVSVRAAQAARRRRLRDGVGHVRWCADGSL